MRRAESEGEGSRPGRREPRVAVDLAVVIGGRVPWTARAVDLSLVGCLVRCEAPLDAGAVVDLRLELPGGAVRAKARVAESSLDGASLPARPQMFLTGLEFMGLGAADEARLRAFVESESKRRTVAPTPSS
jgi:hypothetical protein